MAGSRSLTKPEERLLLRYIRRIAPRDRALISCQLFLGLRISEVLKLRIGQVLDVATGELRARIGVRPKSLKGGYGNTRWIPVCPELTRALGAYITRRARAGALDPESPLILSREHAADGEPKALSRSGAEKLIRTVLWRVGQGDLETLSTHTLRKTWARNLYEVSNNDIILVMNGLGHSSVSVTQAYLSCDRRRLDAMILKSDWTRRPRRRVQKETISLPKEHAATVPAPAPAVALTAVEPVPDFLPGLEPFAA
jgi:integrase